MKTSFNYWSYKEMFGIKPSLEQLKSFVKTNQDFNINFEEIKEKEGLTDDEHLELKKYHESLNG